MNILVAVDLSEASNKVVEAARGVADLTGASVYVLHVVEADPEVVVSGNKPGATQKRIAKDFPLEHKGVSALVEKLQDEGLDANSWLARGPGVVTTLKEADELEAGLIVVGTHGHGAVYDALIGSYSAGIIRKSKLPVLVVPVRNP
ncbi:MAG: universal stress protein [Gammaproteobacteria bacterium]|nr:universal stress protein [Gammaproteobacteria bacterium]